MSMRNIGIGSVGGLLTSALLLAACTDQELGFTGETASSAAGGSDTTGSSENTGGSSNESAASGGTESTIASTAAHGTVASTGVQATSAASTTGAGGSPEEQECALPATRRLFAGYFSTCVLDEAGTPRCFGQDGWEEPTTTAPVVDVAINQEGACALQSDCTIACWGSENMLADFPPSGAFTAIATAEAGAFCAIDVDHEVQCWGPPFGLAGSVWRPAAGDDFFAIAGGETGKFCGLDAAKNSVCWDTSSGAPIPAAEGPFSLLAPADHVCGLGVDGSLTCWGNDTYGATSPPGGSFTSLVSSHVHSCALDEDGQAVCWGQLYFNEESPDLLLSPDETFTTIVTGLAHMCGLTPSGNAVCWGYGTPEGNSGTLPDQGQASPPEGSFVEIAAGFWHTCGLSDDGTVACWGDVSQ